MLNPTYEQKIATFLLKNKLAIVTSSPEPGKETITLIQYTPYDTREVADLTYAIGTGKTDSPDKAESIKRKTVGGLEKEVLDPLSKMLSEENGDFTRKRFRRIRRAAEKVEADNS